MIRDSAQPDPLTPAPGGGAPVLRGLLAALAGALVTGLVAAPAGVALAAQRGGAAEAWALAVALPLQAAALGVAARFTGVPLGFSRPIAIAPVPVAALALLVGEPLARGVAALLSLPEGPRLGAMAEALAGPAGPFIAVGAVCGAAVGEEVFFRGALLSALAQRLRWGLAIPASAALFAVWHGDPLLGVSAFWGGVWLGWLRLRAGSLWPGLLLHALNNLAWGLGWSWPPLSPWLALAPLGLALALALFGPRSSPK